MFPFSKKTLIVLCLFIFSIAVVGCAAEPVMDQDLQSEVPQTSTSQVPDDSQESTVQQDHRKQNKESETAVTTGDAPHKGGEGHHESPSEESHEHEEHSRTKSSQAESKDQALAQTEIRPGNAETNGQLAGSEARARLDDSERGLEEEDRYETEADSAPAIGNTQVGDITIGELPPDWEWLSGGLNRYASVFGVHFFATTNTPDDKLVRSVNVLAEYLDNDADGLVDNEKVLQELLSVDASMIMSDTEDDLDRSLDELPERFHESVEDGDIFFAALFADEVPPNEGPDASLEEILHLITQAGYARAYPDVFGEEPGSEIANHMDVARGGHFAEDDPSDCEDDPDENWAAGQCAVPPNGVYPDDAWYTYTDTTCSYDCMITEYTYWAITSVLGAQSNRCDDIADEWVLCTASQVESRDNGVYRLLGDTSFALPTRLPKGDYSYTRNEIEHQP
jgi:hypothetical protein